MKLLLDFVRFGKKLVLNDILYYMVLICIIVFSTYLNFDANSSEGLVKYYLGFSKYIISGFKDTDALVQSYYTFPMWGYGFIHAITDNKLSILIIQQLLTFVTIIFIEYSLCKDDWFSYNKYLYRILVLFSFNWFLYHTSLWPSSINSNLLVLSFIFLLKYLRSSKNVNLFVSGALFGILVNFRSDYYYYIYFLLILLLGLHLLKKENFHPKLLIVWYSMIFILLVPWGIHSYKTTGSYLHTSTNAGHVLFISLGQLPNNKWGITPYDGDKIMAQLLRENFSNPTSSLAYDGDKYLKKKWFEFVINDPSEYFRKCIYNFYQVIKSPFYNGRVKYDTISHEQRNKLKADINYYYSTYNFTGILKLILNRHYSFLIFPFILNMWGIFVFFYFFFLLIRTIVNKRFDVLFDPISVILNSVVLYQLAILILAFYTKSYHTNIYMVYIILIIFLKDQLSRDISNS